MSEKEEVIRGTRAYHNVRSTRAGVQAIGVIGGLRHRSKKTSRKKKPTRFERKFTALGPLLKPGLKRIDYVLTHKVKNFKDESDPAKKESMLKKEVLRERFEKALRAEGFSIKTVEIDETVYKKIHCPFQRLCKEAETVKLEMPLKGCEKYPAERTTCITETDDEAERTTCITEFVSHFETDDEVDFISAPFIMNKIDMFQGYENPTFFFRPALRSQLTHHILINLDIRNKDEIAETTLQKKEETPVLKPNVLRRREERKPEYKLVEDFILDICSCCPHVFTSLKDKGEEDLYLSKMGLKYLLMKEAYTDAFILHEDSELDKVNKQADSKNDSHSVANADTKPSTISDPRKELNDTWSTWWKFQPLWKIRNYFGEKIAIYFAWCGMLLTSLWIPLLFGLACFIYGLVESTSRVNTGPDMPQNLTLQEEIKWQMGELYNTLRGSFDNNVTPFFALVICLWGTVFLELWKRHIARLAYEWDVDQFEQNEPDRPQFFGTTVKKDPVTQDDNWFYPFKRQLLKFCLSASALIFMISIVCISVAAVVVYRVIISVDFCYKLSAPECLLTTTIVSAVLNAISILALGKFYDWMAVKLTEWENHRTQTQYDNALIIKLFAFSFANSYASCFYIAFFRGRFDTSGVFGIGSKYNDACEGGSCMSQLSFQVLILMLAKPFPKFAKDILLPLVKYLWRQRPACCRSKKVEDEEKKIIQEDTPSLKKGKLFLKTERLKSDLGDFTLPEYTEKVIMYGFLMLFAASFPLAPFIALVWLAIDVRIDAKRLLWLNRRPVAFIAQDIGMWYSILNFVNLIGVISNGFLIAFTSSWGSKYDTQQKLWIIIGFEHLVFALKFILAYLIPDVPKDVRLSIRREKYQVARKFEDKGKTVDYKELVPISTYDDKEDMFYDDKKKVDYKSSQDKMVPVKYRVMEDSANFADFDEDLDSLDSESNQPKDHLTDVDEEQDESTHPNRPSLSDSHGVTSLRQVDPEGSRLLEDPSPKGVKTTKLSPNTSSAFGREPTNMMSLEELSSAPAVIKPRRNVTEDDDDDDDDDDTDDDDDDDESTKKRLPPDPKSIDPYSVVSNADMTQAKKNMSEENDTQC